MDNRTIEQVRENEDRLIKELQQKETIIKEVREYVNTDKNCVPKHIKDYINKIITDKTIKLGDYIDETLEI